MKVLSEAIEVRRDPYLTINGVIKIMSASSAKERETLLYDYKYPEPEGKAQASYYGIARDAIRKYHASNNDISVVESVLASLRPLYAGANPAKVSKLDNNVRALNSYMRNFGSRNLAPLEADRALVNCEGVVLSLKPDFAAVEGKRTRVLRYAFSQKGASDEELRMSLQMLALYAKSAGLDVQNNDIQLLIVADGVTKSLSGISARFEPRLKSAMREVRRIWSDL